MSWDLVLSRTAERSLRSVPAGDRDRIGATLAGMKQEPLEGDIVALKGAYRGSFRRRIGSWRIIFEIDRNRRLIIVHDILRRTSTTY